MSYETEKRWLRIYTLIAWASIIGSVSLVVIAGIKLGTFLYYFLR